MARRNVLAACVLLIFCLAYGLGTARLPERGLPNTPGPAFLPWLITVALTGLSVALLFNGLHAGETSTKTPAAPITARGWLGLGAFAIYLAALPPLGFLTASIPFFAVLTALYGERNRAVIALTAVVVPAALYIVFHYGFQLLLPQGLGW